MPKYESSDSDDEIIRRGRLFGRKRPIHEVLGGGKVADVLLWRNKTLSAALLIGVTAIWFLFEVAEYNFVSLLCHLSITIMLVVFIWARAADYFNWYPPNVFDPISYERTLRDVVATFHKRFNQFLSKFLEIACGSDIAHFFLSIVSLYVLSVIGSCCSFVNLLLFGFLCMLSLPFLYDRFEDEVDDLAANLTRKVKRSYRNFDSNVLDRIPRGPVKEKKKL